MSPQDSPGDTPQVLRPTEGETSADSAARRQALRRFGPSRIAALPMEAARAVHGPTLLEGFSTGLFVQASYTDVMTVSDLVATTGVGVVYTAEHYQRPHHPRDAGAAAEDTRRRARTTNILLDAARYTGARRKPAGDNLSRDWVAFQRQRLLPWALTDGGFAATGDRRGLQDSFTAAARLGSGVIAAAPVAASWLSRDSALLRQLIEDQPNPVALMVEAEKDPFDDPAAVAGLVHVLGAGQPVLLLRSDTSALGALAHGAVVGAVGTGSSRRHIYPVLDRPGPRPRHLSYVIPALLGYHLDSRFQRAYLADPTLACWLCACPYCRGYADLAWIGRASDPAAAAFQHSVASLALMGAGLMQAAAGGSLALAWSQACALAQAAYDPIEAASGKAWSPKRVLRNWIRVTPSTVGR